MWDPNNKQLHVNYSCLCFLNVRVMWTRNDGWRHWWLERGSSYSSFSYLSFFFIGLFIINHSLVHTLSWHCTICSPHLICSWNTLWLVHTNKLIIATLEQPHQIFITRSQLISQFCFTRCGSFGPLIWVLVVPRILNLIMMNYNLPTVTCLNSHLFNMELFFRLCFHSHSRDIISHFSQFTPETNVFSFKW